MSTSNLTRSERDLIRDDLGQLLEILGLGDYARPESPHEVFRERLARVAKLRDGARMLGNVTAGLNRAMEAARIEMRQNGPHAAMQWILNSLPDVWDGPEDTAWDGEESAQAWFDRTEEAYRAAPQPSPAPQSAAADSQRIALDHARSALRRLASPVPVREDEASEAGARCDYAERMLGDIARMLGEGQ